MNVLNIYLIASVFSSEVDPHNFYAEPDSDPRIYFKKNGSGSGSRSSSWQPISEMMKSNCRHYYNINEKYFENY